MPKPPIEVSSLISKVKYTENMLHEFNVAHKYFKEKFGESPVVPAGDYAIPIDTSRGDAFMKVTIHDDNTGSGFDLWWDEAMTVSWYTQNPDGTPRQDVSVPVVDDSPEQ